MHDIPLDAASPYWHGVVRVLTGKNGGVIPRRMSESHEEWYLARPENQRHWFNRCLTATGCRICAAGNIRRLQFSARHISQCRDFFGYDVMTPEGFCKSFTSLTPQENVSFDVELPENTTGITLMLPYQAEVEVLTCQVTAYGDIAPVAFEGGSWIFVGDSITQGWEAVSPKDTYAARVADALKVDYVNVSVGGIILDSENVSFAMQQPWEHAILALGTNDPAWRTSVERFAEEADKAIDILQRRPNAKLMVLIPIWWPGEELDSVGADLMTQNRQTLRKLSKKYTKVQFIEGEELIPQNRTYYQDNAHPNAEGMKCLADNLLSKILN